MRDFILSAFILSSMLLGLSCGGSNRTLLVKQFASFEVKADLATKQLYQTLAEQDKLNTKIDALIKCNQNTQNEINILKKLDVKIKSQSGNIFSVVCDAKSLPKLADLEFIHAIEAGKRVKLR